MWMILFLLLPLLGVAYCSWHLWVLLPVPRLWRILIVGIGVCSFLLMFLNLSRTIDRLPMPLARLSYDIGNSSIFVMLYMTMLFLVLDIGRLLHIVPRHWLYQNIYATVAIAGGLFIVFLVGNIQYNNKVRQTIHLTTTKRLTPPAAAVAAASSADTTAKADNWNPRILMMSDLHLGYHNPKRELARWVDIVNAEHPDIVLIAGDIIDMSIRPLSEENMAQEFHRINAPIYACLGNHEYYCGLPQAQQFFRDANIHLLRDTCATVGSILIVGRDDRTNQHRKTLEKIMAEARRNGDYKSPQTDEAGTAAKEYFTILLDHQPYQLEQAEKLGIDLQLSGHTHRGQLWPISAFTDRMYECSWGQWQRGNTQYFVSSGMGIWGGKFRIGTQSEYVVLQLDGLQQP